MLGCFVSHRFQDCSSDASLNWRPGLIPRRTEDKDPGQNRAEIPRRQSGKGHGSGGKKVVQILPLFVLSASGTFDCGTRLAPSSWTELGNSDSKA
jgi:hypothetical protein